ncbi:hypothetical protein Tco_0240641 [Tanacetum coccineum]
MSSESTSSQTHQLLTPSSKNIFKDFWYTTEVDDATKDILFSLSSFENRLSFTRNDLLSVIGLTDSETVVPLPSKGTVRASSATSFQTSSASEVSLTSHMLKVAKLSKKPEKSLILPSVEVNAEESADKSQSETNVQPLSQPKAPTAKRPRKKKNPSSTQPMVLRSSRSISTSSPPTTHLQHVEEFVVTADATKNQIVEEKEIAGEHSLDIPSDGTLLDDSDKQTNDD